MMKTFFLLLGLLAVTHCSVSALGDQLQFHLDHTDGESAASGKYEEEMKMPVQFEVNGETYVYHAKALPFWAAEADCKRIGGHLTSIHTEDINKYVNGAVLHYNSNAYRTWLGGYRTASNYIYRWTDGSRWDYSRWALNRNGRSTLNRCVEMDHRQTGRWVVDYCDKRRPYVCKL